VGAGSWKNQIFPRVHALTGYLLSSAEKPSEQILQMIQNGDFDTEKVKVLNRTEDETCFALTLEVNQTSFERLSRQGRRKVAKRALAFYIAITEIQETRWT
jgi:hypothetical protein